MIHVQQHGMRAFKHDPLTRPEILDQHVPDIIHIWFKPAAEIAVIFKNLLPVHRRRIVKRLEHFVPLADHEVPRLRTKEDFKRLAEINVEASPKPTEIIYLCHGRTGAFGIKLGIRPEFLN